VVARAPLSHRSAREALTLELYGVIRSALKNYVFHPRSKRNYGQCSGDRLAKRASRFGLD
jgi:hypothetical protein